MVLPDSPRALSSSSSPLSSCVTASKIKSQVKSPPFITPPVIHPAAPSSQEILKDVADMKEDLIRMTAILQTDTQTAAKTVQTSNTGTPKEPKLDDEEPFTLVERVKEDLVKVSEILQKNIMNDNNNDTVSEDEWEEFSRDEIEEAQMSVLSDYYHPLDESTVLLKHQSSKELDLAQVVDFLTNDIGASSLSKMAELKSRYEEETKREGEEKLKRVLKPSMSIQEHKLKMPPPVSGMIRSPSEKDLSRLAESYPGTDVILESPEDLSHEQDKSPLSDSGFETRSEKTPSAPQSAESTGPKPLFTESPIPPCVSETRTEVVHIRSFEPSDEACEPPPVMEAASAIASTEPDAAQMGATTALQMKLSEDSMMNKSMCLKEETHITTTTRMVYHKPPLTDGTEMIEEGMSVRDLMKAFQSGRDPSKELAGLFEHKSNQDSVKGDELTPRFLDRDVKSKPKVERIIEVHIEKGHSTAEPTEVIIRETKKHPELYVYKGDHGIKELTVYDEVQQEEEELTAEEYLPSFLESRVNTPVSQEEDSRPSSAQLIADDSYKALKLLSQHSIEYCDDELSEIRGESYNFAEKMLLSEKLDMPLSHSDLDDAASAADKKHHLDSGHSGAEFQQHGSPKREYVSKSSKDGSPKSGKFLQRDEPSQFDKVTVLHYSTEQGSPKHAVWMRFTEDKQDRSRDKLLYEDRVDQTVKEAEEKLCEVSQFFRDKTEKLNDELQSPEKKPLRRELKEPRSWPSSVRSSPERTMQKPKTGDEAIGRSKLREPSVVQIFGSTGTPEKKSSSLPSSPQKGASVHPSKETIQKESKTSESESSTSKVSAARIKFESAAQKQSPSSPIKIPPPVQPKPSIKKLQESKLPVYQYSSAGKVSKVSETAEKISPKKDTCPLTDGSKSTAIVAKFTEDKFLNKNVPPESPQSRNQVTETRKAACEDSNNHFNQNTPLLQEKDGEKNNWVTKRETASKEPVAQGPPKDTELINTNLRKKTESQIPVKSSSTLDTELTKKQSATKAQISTIAKSKTQKSVETPVNTDKNLTFEILDNAPRDSNFNNLPSPREALEKVLTPPTTVTKENFRGIKTLPVYVSVQVGRQAEREAKGSLYTVKQTTNSTVSLISPDDDTMEQVSFIDSSGKSPLTPETPSSEEVSYDLTSRTPDAFMGFVPGKPSPIMEVCEESEEDEGKAVLSFREKQPEPVVPSTQGDLANLANANRETPKTIDNQPNINQLEKTADGSYDEKIGQVQREASKDKGIAYIEFPPPPPLDSSETSDAERKGSCASSETETEMMEVNLQEEHDKHLLTEPIIRIQPPTPVHPSADDSQSNDDESDRDDDESIFQPIRSKKFISKAPEEDEEEKKVAKEKTSKCKKHDKNGNDKEQLDGTNGSKGSNGQGEDYECEQNGNDQSITDCSIATTAEFSHDTDATEIDSLDGYELQDEDDGLCEEADLQLFGLPNSRRDVWATDTFRSSDHSFPPTKLEVIEEEKSPEECQTELFKNDVPSNGEKDDGVSLGEVKGQDQKPSGKEGFSDTYFSYKLGEDFNSPFKTVATKGLDFDPWPSKGGEEVVHVGGPQGGEGEPKPFGLAVDDQSQATTPDTTPARTPTDDSTPTSEPNPFPFHEGKMFEMTRSGAIDMSKRDMVEERLQFFQIGEHCFSAGRYRVRDLEIDAFSQDRDQFDIQDPTDTLIIPPVPTHTTTVELHISNVMGSYTTCRDSASSTELKFSTFKSGVKCLANDTSNSSNSSSDCNISGTVDGFQAVTSVTSEENKQCCTFNTLSIMDPSDYKCPSGQSKHMEFLDWNPTKQSTFYQSRDIYSAPSQETSSPPTGSNSSSHKTTETHSDVTLSDAVVLNLSYLGPTLQEVNGTGASVSQVEDSNVAIANIAAENVKDKICKSRLPVRVCSNKLWNQRQQIVKPKPCVKQCVVQRVGNRLDPFEKEVPKSKIPVMKDAKHPSVLQDQRRVGPRSFTGRAVREPSRSSTDHRPSLVDSPGRRSTKEIRRKSTEVTTKLRKRASTSRAVCVSDQSNVMQTRIEGKALAKDGEENHSLSSTRNTSLCRASRGPCPPRTSTSTSTTTSTPPPRDVRAEGVQASSERMRNKRKSSRSLGKKEEEEGNQGDQPITAPVTENQTSL